MKELFTNPEIEIYKFTCEDVVCTSLEHDDGGNMNELDESAPTDTW